MRKVIVIPYDPEWKNHFEKAASEIQTLFGKECLQIHHIGSTAVAGLSAKPIIDLMPVVRDVENVDSYNGKMQELGYVAKGENRLAGRRYFERGGDKRSHHVHIFQIGNPEIQRHLAFRDYLAAHPLDALKYGTLKEKLAVEYPFDIEKYITGKTEMVSSIEKKAMEEL